MESRTVDGMQRLSLEELDEISYACRIVRTINVALLGDASSGKTSFVYNTHLFDTDKNVERCPTNTIVMYRSEQYIEGVGNVSLRFHEYGASRQGLLDNTAPLLPPYPDAYRRMTCSNAVVVGLFYAHGDEMHWENIKQRWTHAAFNCMNHCDHYPFVFVVETRTEKCDDDDDDEALRSSRMRAETYLYETFGRAFLFFQIDTRSREQCAQVVDQVFKQLCYQKPIGKARPKSKSCLPRCSLV